MKPKPNEHGHYDEKMCTVFEWKENSSHMRIRVIEAKPGVFLTGHDFSYGCGNWHGSCGGPSINGHRFSTLADAVEYERQHALRHFDPAALHPFDSCVSKAQKLVSATLTAKLMDGWPLHTGLSSPQLALFGNAA